MTQLQPNTIIFCDGFHYLFLGMCDSPEALRSPNASECIVSSIDPTDESANQYFWVRAVFPVEGKYYFIPSSFSYIGTLSVDRKWTVLTTVDALLPTLHVDKCEILCPGYLD